MTNWNITSGDKEEVRVGHIKWKSIQVLQFKVHKNKNCIIYWKNYDKIQQVQLPSELTIPTEYQLIILKAILLYNIRMW